MTSDKNNSLRILLLLLLTVIIAIFLYFMIKVLINFANTKNAIQSTMSNTIHCGKETCDPPSDTLNPPLPDDISDDEWQTPVARYVANLVYILENSANKNEKLVFPTELKLNKKLYNFKDEPVFGVVLSSEKYIWIILRGTQSRYEWSQDFEFKQTQLLDNEQSKQAKIKFLENSNDVYVHKGFVNAYLNFRTDILNTLNKINKDKSKLVIISGHSLGGGISTISGVDIINNGYKTVVYNFASPRVGNTDFCNLVKNMGLKVFRVVNTSDLVPTLPYSVMYNVDNPDKPYQYIHCGEAKYFSDNWKSVLNNHLIGVHMKALKEM